MAIQNTTQNQVPYNSPGIYFQETDLTVISRQTGGFSAAAICLTESGPAFTVSNSTTFSDRAFRMGNLNPDFPSSYFAKQYLEQARNYKEVRMLGLEGYKDTVGFGITYAATGTVAANLTDINDPVALQPGVQGLVCVLKARSTVVTGGAVPISAVVSDATYIDPLTGLSTSNATDYLFTLTISYQQPNVGSVDPTVVVLSLRPSSKNYILKKLGTDPLATPLLGSTIAPLWCDFIIPSVESMPTIDSTDAYYVPGISSPQNYLSITQGETVFGTTFTFQNGTINAITPTNSSVTVSVTGDVTSWLTNGSSIEITNVAGTGNIGALNGTFNVTSVAFASGNTTFQLLNPTTNAAVTNIITTSVLSGTVTATISKYIIPTWQNQVLDFSNTTYTTPQTPWFVSDGDANGHVKQLFRFWTIADGDAADTNVKVEIKNINPSAYNGNGSFDVYVRQWGDTEDISTSNLEIFANLTLDTTNTTNYILQRIGDGNNYALKSRFVFCELNTSIEIDADDLPWGCTGYPNITGILIPDVPWTTDYNKQKTTAKQTLGLASNSINMNAPMCDGYLKYKSSNGIYGLGFHLNPNNNTNLTTVQAANFVFAAADIFQDQNGNNISAAAKVAASKFVADFFGGFDGWNVYSTRTFGDTSSADYQSLQLAIAQLADKEDINADFTVLVTPDMQFDTMPNACSSVLDMVNSRGDCLYIPDLSYDPLANSTAAIEFLLSSDMMSNNAAVYFPWLQIQDTVNTIKVWEPPSILALGTITYVSTNVNVWQPPGGSVMTVTNNLVRTVRRLNITDREILFNSQAQINPITSFPGSGYEIAGVRTTQPDFSALSFIHNRLLLCYAKKVLTQVLRPLLFQLNNQLTQDAFLNVVSPIFARIKKLNGIADFSVSITNNDQTAADKTTIYGTITIVPLYPVERIICEFQLSDSIVSFNENSSQSS